MTTRNRYAASAFTFFALSSLWLAAAQTEGQMLSGNDFRRTVACEGQNVTLSGNDNRLELTGLCPRVILNGSDNVVNVESVQEITLRGSNNQITWFAAGAGETPLVTEQGTDNQVIAGNGGAPAQSGSSGDVAADDRLVFDSLGGTYTVACEGRDVDVTGAGVTLTLTGECGTVNVIGATNTITVEAVEAVEATGAGNTVRWGRAVGGDTPRVESTGFGNDVAQGQ